MKHIQLFRTLSVAAILSVTAAAQSAEPLSIPDQPAKTEAKLLADVSRIAAGEPFEVGVLFDIPDYWYIYWKNPGDAGVATRVDLDLPEGFTAGPLRWPAPVEFTQPGDLKGYGYRDKVLLLRTVTPPDELEGGPVAISADVSWLECKDVCVIGKEQLSIELRAGDEPEADNAELFEKWKAQAPTAATDFELADTEGETVRLSDSAGKIRVLEWFNPDCPFVKRHHGDPDTMKGLIDKYGDEGVVWMAINSTHYMTPEKTAEWREKWDLDYPILIDRDGEVGRAYGAKTTPHMYVIDADGLIVYAGGIDDDPHGRKEEPVNYVDAALSELLAGEPIGTPHAKPYGCSVKYAK